MLFNSYTFIFAFLPIVLIGYFSLNRTGNFKLGKAWLLASSLFFYGYWSPKNVPLFLFSIGVNYALGHFIQKASEERKGTLLKLGLAFNILLLCFFKYTGGIALPLGISFYTLQQIAFLMDVREGLTEEKGFLNYAVFVSFFPHLTAGPIDHYREIMPQLEETNNKSFHADKFALGIFLFSLGLFKKVILSDTFSTWATPGFDQTDHLDFLAAWKTSLCYTFQLYFDFSGYSEMALGLGHMFNIHIAENFHSPFKSVSIIEFWSRWHMSLSQFINTYIYTPLLRAMPKINFRNAMISTFVAMTIAGIWHGAGWTYLIYGGLHGAALVLNHMWKKKKKKMPSWVAWLLTFNFVNVTFIVFRARDLAAAWKVLKGMLGLTTFIVPKIGISKKLLLTWGLGVGTYLKPDDYLLLLMLIGSFVLVTRGKNVPELAKEFRPSTKLALVASCLFVLSLFALNRVTEFIYFNF